MSKGKRTKAARRGRATRRIIHVDALEVGQRDGMMTWRADQQSASGRPLRVVVPANMAQPLAAGLHNAALDAEEEYWNIVPALMRQLGESPSPDAAAAHMERWLRSLDWPALLRSVPAGDKPPYLLTHAGHVALALDPPFTVEPVLLILDPQQLHRLRGSFLSAIADGLNTPPTAPWSMTQSVSDVHRFLISQPWPPPSSHEVAPEHAAASMQSNYRDFLARSPFVRSNAGVRDLISAGANVTGGSSGEAGLETDVGAPSTPEMIDCDRCAASKAIGGIICICGHDWSCHGDAPDKTEPCSHCPCLDMTTPEQVGA